MPQAFSVIPVSRKKRKISKGRKLSTRPTPKTREDEISFLVIGAALNISARVGSGLTESAYETILYHDLTRRGLFVERQKKISFDYDGIWIKNAFRLDLVIDQLVVVEIKSKPELTANHFKQVTTYLRLTEYKLGLLLNFGVPGLKNSIKRIANGL